MQATLPNSGLAYNPSGDTDNDWAATLQANAEILEGFFSPPAPWPTSPQFGGHDGNPTVTTGALHAGYYVKSGTRIDVCGTLNITSISGGSGYAYIVLPFPVANIANLTPLLKLSRLAHFNSAVSDLFDLTLRCEPGTNRAYFQSSGRTSGQILEDISFLQNNFIAAFQGTYWIDTPA